MFKDLENGIDRSLERYEFGKRKNPVTNDSPPQTPLERPKPTNFRKPPQVEHPASKHHRPQEPKKPNGK